MIESFVILLLFYSHTGLTNKMHKIGTYIAVSLNMKV